MLSFDVDEIGLCSQESETSQVVDAAWSFFARTIRTVDSLKRYQGLRSALRMVTNQVPVPIPSCCHCGCVH